MADNPFDIEFNSCSTMHKIADKEFTIDDFSHEHLTFIQSEDLLHDTIDTLNFWRDIYQNGGMVYLYTGTAQVFKPKDKEPWWQMIQLLPSSYMQKRTLKMNYEVLAALHKWRKPHRMGDGHWDVVTDWIESLPYSEIITCEEAE